MRLSEAIRVGSRMKPPGIGSGTVIPENTTVCALGAAGCAGGFIGYTTNSIYTALQTRWPILNEVIAKGSFPGRYPLSPSAKGTVTEAVYVLNDCDQMPRERIADWVEEVENEALECGLLTPEQLGD